MAKPSKSSKKPAAPANVAAPAKVVARSEVRNSPIPKIAAAPAVRPATPVRAITHEQVARRAYEIWSSGQGGSEFENWIRAERELRGA